jgi:hypothetical protein
MEPQNKDFSSTQCTGCACNSTLICVGSVNLYKSNASCSLANVINYQFYGYGVSNKESRYCEPVAANTAFYAYNLNSQSADTNQSGCSPAGTPTVPTANWGTKTNFCAASRTSTNNCGSDKTKICVPKPPSGNNLCVRIPGTTGTCPNGYNGSSGVWYAGADSGTCSQCGGCGHPQASCTGQAGIAVYNVAGGGPGTCDLNHYGVSDADTTACSSHLFTPGGSAINFPTALTGIGWSGLGGTQSITCDPPTVTTTAPASPKGPSVICCP